MPPHMKPAHMFRHRYALVSPGPVTCRRHTLGARGWRSGEVWHVTVCYLDVPPQVYPIAPVGLTMVGLAFCAPPDQFSRKIGRAIAQGRARQGLVDMQAGKTAKMYWRIQNPALLAMMKTIGWYPWVMYRTMRAPFQYRLPEPRPLPLNPLFQKALFSGEVGRVENMRFISLYDDREAKPE